MDPGSPFDMQQLLAAAQEMQEQLVNAQEELADAEVEGTAGGGLVKAVVNGQGALLDLTIAPAAIDPGDPADTAQTVADLVLAAIRDATRAVEELQQQKMGPFAAGFGGALGGAGGDMPWFPGGGLGGLLGGGGQGGPPALPGQGGPGQGGPGQGGRSGPRGTQGPAGGDGH